MCFLLLFVAIRAEHTNTISYWLGVWVFGTCEHAEGKFVDTFFLFPACVTQGVVCLDGTVLTFTGMFRYSHDNLHQFNDLTTTLEFEPHLVFNPLSLFRDIKADNLNAVSLSYPNTLTCTTQVNARESKNKGTRSDDEGVSGM